MSEKKRTTYKKGSKLDLPKHVDKTKHAYRWISAENLNERSDGYEHRGWEIDTNPEGKTTKSGDLILGRMPLDQFEVMKQEKDEARKSQLDLVFQKQAEEAEREAFAFRKKGGKMKFSFEQE